MKTFVYSFLTLSVVLCLTAVSVHAQVPANIPAQAGPLVQEFSPAALNPFQPKRAPNPNPLPSDWIDPIQVLYFRQIEEFKQDGLTRNHAHVPEMLALIKDEYRLPANEHSHNERQVTILLALARMGATEAVPAIDEVMSDPNPWLAMFTRAARARLLAETESTPHAKAARFFREIGETPDQLNAVMQEYNQQDKHWIEKNYRTPVSQPIPYKERYAEEELADMIYHDHRDKLLTDSLIAQVDFHQWPNAYLKVEMSVLTPEQQRQKLIDRILKGALFFVPGQLLIDLGRIEAIEAIIARLEDIDENNEDYKQCNCGVLWTILYMCGDQGQSPVWTHLAHISAPKVKEGVYGAKNQLWWGY